MTTQVLPSNLETVTDKHIHPSMYLLEDKHQEEKAPNQRSWKITRASKNLRKTITTKIKQKTQPKSKTKPKLVSFF